MVPLSCMNLVGPSRSTSLDSTKEKASRNLSVTLPSLFVEPLAATKPRCATSSRAMSIISLPLWA